MAELCYVDNSNLFIEGKFVSAVKNGLAQDVYQAHMYDLQDRSFRVDLGKLY